MTQSFEQLLNESASTLSLEPGSIVSGVVEHIGKDFVQVNVGLKSEGFIPVSQFYNMKGELEINVGDQVDVVIEMLEDGYGNTRLSREKAKRAAAWIELEKCHESGETVVGLITGKVKGGFTVEVDSVRAFLPGSLVDVRPSRESAHLEGKQLEFKIIKMDQKRNNIVVSRRAVLEENMVGDRAAIIENLAEGQTVKGVVKNLTDYGVFIDLGGIDGLLHITDMSWKRIKHPSEMVNIGDELDVIILKFDRERGRVSLGLKQLGSDPWSSLVNRYPVGTKLTGQVTNVTDYGCFVELETGIEGLVHMSEMDWTNKNIHPSKVVQLGDTVQVMVLEIDQERRRISLGVKQCHDNPWASFASKHKVGEKISGSIKSITDFGVFIGLEGGIDGLVHSSDLSAEKSAEEAIREYKKGDEIEAVILTIDAERERIALGVKQLHMDPFEWFVDEQVKKGSVKATVIEKSDTGYTVELTPEHNALLSLDATETPLNVGDEVSVSILSSDKDTQTIHVTTKSAKQASGKAAGSKASTKPKKMEQSSANTTLGDLLKAKMEGSQED